MLDWLMNDVGGLSEMDKLNKAKASLLYNLIDDSDIFKSPVRKNSRSSMNIVFDLEDAEISLKFSQMLKDEGFVGLDGHRNRGGFRASLYNPVTIEDVSNLVEFMSFFEKRA